jgi:putative PIN family toxin of toxin-antitoxin system
LICVIDSSVWVSGFQFGGTPLKAIDLAIQKHTIAICRPILRELRITLSKTFNWSQTRIDGIFANHLDRAILLEITGQIRGICGDPNDDMVLECAVLAKADFILRRLGPSIAWQLRRPSHHDAAKLSR